MNLTVIYLTFIYFTAVQISADYVKSDPMRAHTCTEMSLLTEYWCTGTSFLAEHFVLEHPYRLNILYWNVLPG
jgi:hypothetical protein